MTPSVRFSRLKQIAQSPAHYRYAADRADDASPGSPAMARGRAVHAVVLGTPYAVWDGPVRRGKEWDAFALEHAGVPVMNTTEYDMARAMRASVLRHDIAREMLFANGMVREQRIDWTRDGVACHGTPDAYGNGLVVDLKTTKCAEPERFVRDAKWRAYHAQLAFYASGLLALGVETQRLAIVAVEAVAPYVVTVFELDATAWTSGDALVASWWERMRQCEAAGVWPGYTEAAVRFGVDDETLSIGGEDFEI